MGQIERIGRTRFIIKGYDERTIGKVLKEIRRIRKFK